MFSKERFRLVPVRLGLWITELNIPVHLRSRSKEFGPENAHRA